MIYSPLLLVALSALHGQSTHAWPSDFLGVKHSDLQRRGEQLHKRQNNKGYFQAPVINIGGYTYNINITVGTPPQHIQLQLDTGSPSPWLPASNDTECKNDSCPTGSFNPRDSSTFRVVDRNGFNASYLDYWDFDAGDWANDTFGFEDGTFLPQQLFGLAFTGADSTGVLGLQPGTPSKTLPVWGAYPALIDELELQGVIGRKALSLYLNDFYSPEGSIVFGGLDTTKYTGDLVALPFPVDNNGYVQWYSATVTGISFTNFNGTTEPMASPDLAACMTLDSGTPTLLLPFTVFTRLAEGFGAVYSEAAEDSQYVVPCKYKGIEGSVNFELGGEDGIEIKIPLSRLFGEQVLTHDNFTDPSGGCEFMISPTSEYAGVLGDPFLRNAYAVYDATNNLTAVAEIVFNQTHTSNIVPMPAGETTIPGATRTGTATASQFYITQTYVNPTPLADHTKHGRLESATPTFDLGISSSGSYIGAGSSLRSAAIISIGLAVAFVI